MYFGWIRKSQVISILLEIRKQYEIKDGTISKDFYIGGQDSIELAIEKIVGQKNAFQLLQEIDTEEKVKAKGLINRRLF